MKIYKCLVGKERFVFKIGPSGIGDYIRCVDVIPKEDGNDAVYFSVYKEDLFNDEKIMKYVCDGQLMDLVVGG